MTTTMGSLTKSLVKAYDPDDASFTQKALDAVDAYFAGLKPSTSKIDPLRLGSKSTLISQIRRACLEKAGPFEEEGQEEFNKMDVIEQQKFQLRSRLTDMNKWVHDLPIVPDNLKGLLMADNDSAKLMAVRGLATNTKLRTEMTEIDGDKLMSKLCPNLEEPKRRKLSEVVAALILVTGRRTIEIMKTGDIYLGEGHSKTGYVAMFTGQAKRGLKDDEAYEIPLLAPFYMVRAALDVVRLTDTSGMSSAEVNTKYSRNLLNYLRKRCDLNPHRLRDVYAMMAFSLLPQKKMSLIGFVSKILGHEKPENAAFYQTTSIVNFSGPWNPNGEPAEAQAEPIKPQPKRAKRPDNVADEPESEPQVPQPEPEDDQEPDLSSWNYSTKPEKKRIVALIDMMQRRKRITATSARAAGGGSMPLLEKVISKNQAKIDAYNASLAK